MSDSNRVKLSFQKQTEKGTIDGSSPFKEVRHTGGSFGEPIETGRSGMVRSDAQRGPAVRLGKNPAAVYNIELMAKIFDDLMSGFLRNGWSTPVDASGTDITADNSASKFVSTENVDWTGKNIAVGQWVYASGFDEEGANGWFKVVSVSEDDLEVTPAPADDTNTESKSISVEGSYVRNGTQDFYYALQCEHEDLTDAIRLIKDARIGQMSLTSNARAIVTGSFNFEGVSFEKKTSLSGNGEYDKADETEVLNSTDHVGAVYIDGDAYDGCLMDFSLTGNTNARRQNCIGQLNSADVRLGAMDVSGSLSIYLTDTAWSGLFEKYRSFSKVSFAFPFTDSAGNGYVFEIIKAALTNEPGNIPGPDGDVMLSFDFEAEPGSIGGESKTIQICRRVAPSE